MESRNVMKKYIGILAKITGFILIVILAVNIILPLIKRNPYDRKCKKVLCYPHLICVRMTVV